MNNLNKIVLAIALAFMIPFTSAAQKPGVTKYKCMVQMTNYVGEAAYIVVSLVNPTGAYEKTLYVMGPDKSGIPISKNGISLTPKNQLTLVPLPAHL